MSRDSYAEGARTLVVLAPEMGWRYPELVDFEAGSEWRSLPELGAALVEVGPGSRWPEPAAVVNFLRSLLDSERLAALRACWLPTGAEPTDHLPALIHARPLLEVIPVESGPLPRLLRDGRLETWYQPIFRAGDLKLWGYECLMRGRTEDGTLVNPAKLLAWAEQQQLGAMLDRAARETHLQNAGRANLPDHAHVLINFLPTAIYQPEHCLQSVLEITRACQLEPKRVIFEVVESGAVTDYEHLNTILGYYRKHGFRVGLDDVGNGHSGLIMLADIEPDLIKIDRYLVQRAPYSPSHRRVCASLIEIAHEQRKLILAEGVEKPEERAVMDLLGVDLHQGYLFGRPSPEPVTTPLALAQTG